MSNHHVGCIIDPVDELRLEVWWLYLFQLKHFHVSYLRFIMTNKHCTFGSFNLESLLKIIMFDIIDLNPPLHHVLHTKKEMSWSYKPWWHILATNCVEPINMTKRRKRSLSTEWIKLLESFPIKQRFRDSPCFLFENLIFWSFLWYMLRKINCLFIYCWCYKTTVTSRTIFLLAPGSNVSEEDDYNLNTMLTKLCCWIRRALYFRHTQILYAQIGCQFVSIVLLMFHPLAILIIVWLCWACSLWKTFDSPSWNYYLRCSINCLYI